MHWFWRFCCRVAGWGRDEHARAGTNYASGQLPLRDDSDVKDALSPEDAPVRWCYHLNSARLQSDDIVVVEVGGSDGRSFFDGVQEIPPDDPDYVFWKWIIDKQFRATVNDQGLQELRTRFEKHGSRKAE